MLFMTDTAIMVDKPAVTVSITRYPQGIARNCGGGSNTPVSTFTSLYATPSPSTAPIRLPPTSMSNASLQINAPS